MSNLIDIDLQEYEPEEEGSEPEEDRSRSTGGERRRPPHPPGPAGLFVPRTRVWIKRPPGPAGL